MATVLLLLLSSSCAVNKAMPVQHRFSSFALQSFEQTTSLHSFDAHGRGASYHVTVYCDGEFIVRSIGAHLVKNRRNISQLTLESNSMKGRLQNVFMPGALQIGSRSIQIPPLKTIAKAWKFGREAVRQNDLDPNKVTGFAYLVTTSCRQGAKGIVRLAVQDGTITPSSFSCPRGISRAATATVNYDPDFHVVVDDYLVGALILRDGARSCLLRP